MDLNDVRTFIAGMRDLEELRSLNVQVVDRIRTKVRSTKYNLWKGQDVVFQSSKTGIMVHGVILGISKGSVQVKPKDGMFNGKPCGKIYVQHSLIVPKTEWERSLILTNADTTPKPPAAAITQVFADDDGLETVDLDAEFAAEGRIS